MPKVIIQRSTEYSNSLRDYKMYIDGTITGKISNGGMREFEVGAGSHTLVSKIDWAGSPEIKFDIKEGETKTFIVAAHKGSNWLLIVTVAIVFIGFAMKRTNYGQYYPILLIPISLIVIYYLTMGKKKYLSLTET